MPKANEPSPEPLMSIWDHVNELRKRLTVAFLAFVVAVIITFNFTPQIIDFLAIPVGGIQRFLAIQVTENIGVFFRVSMLAAFILTFPVFFYELLAFILPGLTPSEKRWIYLFIPFGTFMFLAGAAFTYYVMLPVAIPFLLDFMGIKNTPRPSDYIDFVTTLIFWVGISFETPIVVFLLAKLRFISARQLARGWRYALVIIAIAAALITPTGDPVNMGLLMLPLSAIYLLSILMAAIARREKKPAVQDEAPPAA